MSFSLVAAMLMVLGAPVSARAADLQVEAVTAAGDDWPELRDAVARALVVGGARVVMRGPSAGPCDDCIPVKVIETDPGIFRIETQDQDRQVSTTLDLSGGTRLLDRARAIAIHTRLLIGKKPVSENKKPAAATWPKGKPETRDASAHARSKPQDAVSSVAEATRPPAPGPLVVPAAEVSTPVLPPAPVLAHTRRADNTATSHTPESKPGPSVVKVAEEKRLAPAEPDGSQAVDSGASSNVVKANLAASSATPAAWPWIPISVGTAAALGAGVCALVAKNRYDGLSDRTQPVDHARSLRSSGESWQTTAFVLSGVAAAALATGIVGFATRSTGQPAVNATISPMPHGGLATLAWGLP